jgi:hypothetical protein
MWREFRTLQGMRRRAATLILLSLFAGCAEKSPSAPSASAPTVTGTWVGTVTIDGVTARMTWTLTQTDSSVSGPVLVGFPSGTVLLNGFLTGSVLGTTLPYVISVGPGGIPTRPTCVGQLSGTMAVNLGATSTLEGPMAITSSTCTPPLTGSTLTLTRQ